MTSYVLVWPGTESDPGRWAARREIEGWHGVGVPDHAWVNGTPLPHVWTTLAQMAMATERIHLASSFANNLLRSPVEFAQAALSLQRLSGGRFEAGLGAGWDAVEAAATATEFPPARVRAERMAEAARIVRDLFDSGSSRFSGAHYQVDVASIVSPGGPPPLFVASSGGPRTLAALTPVVDVLELKPTGLSVPGRGTIEIAALRGSDLDGLRRRAQEAWTQRSDVIVGTFLFAECSGDPEFAGLRSALSGTMFGRLLGSPSEAAELIAELRQIGIERFQISPLTPATVDALGPLLLET